MATKRNVQTLAQSMSFSDACRLLASESKDYDQVMVARIVVQEAIASFQGLIDKASPYLDNADEFLSHHELDDDIIYQVNGKAYKTHASINNSIELDKSLLNESEIPDIYYDRSPRLSHKMVKDAYKKICSGEMESFGNISTACSEVVNKKVQTFEVDPVTFKKVTSKKEDSHEK